MQNRPRSVRLEKLAYRMKAMGASYLQTGANVTNVTGGPRGAPSSLIQTQQAAPSPATHAIFRLLKAGESVFQTLLLT